MLHVNYSKHAAYGPSNMIDALFKQLKKGAKKKGIRLDRASTGLVLYESVEIAEAVYNGQQLYGNLHIHRLPPEVIGLAVVFLAGSLTGKLEADVPFEIAGILFDTKIAEHN